MNCAAEPQPRSKARRSLDLSSRNERRPRRLRPRQAQRVALVVSLRSSLIYRARLLARNTSLWAVVAVPKLSNTCRTVETQEKVPCVCGEGAIEVKSTLYGKWRVDEVTACCQACGSDDIAKARDSQEAQAPKK